MTQDQLLHTYGPKVFTDNQISQIKYNYYINNIFKDYDNSQRNGPAEDSITYTSFGVWLKDHYMSLQRFTMGCMSGLAKLVAIP
jgi:hypothetical protein